MNYRFADSMPIVESTMMVRTVEDWSRVRSPSRARRRMRYGHIQNIVYRQEPMPDLVRVGHKLVGHPETIRKAFQHINTIKRA